MTTYHVALSAQAWMNGYTTVEAESKEEAEELALDEGYSGDIIWKYNGLTEEDIQVTNIDTD